MSDLATGRPITADDLFNILLVSDPRVSPDGSRVAYVVTRLDKEADDYKAALWLVSVDGGEPRQLTSGAARDTEPRWSPDGTKLAFVSNRAPELTVPDPDTAKDDAADDNADGESTSAPAKPKSTADKPAKPKPQIWVIPVDGGEARQLTRQPHGASSPAWSPDGQAVAFLSMSDDPGAAPKTVADERVITDLRYRSDGRGFVERRHTHVWSIPAAGGDATQLTFGDTDDADIAWRPDGAELAFVGNRTPERGLNSVAAVYAVPATGGEPRPIVEVDGRFGAPAWSPDGERLAVTGSLEAGAVGRNEALWVVSAAGGDARNLTQAWDRSFADAGMSDVYQGSDVRPVWASDGDSILALASDRGATHLHRVAVEDGSVSPVTAGGRRVTAFGLAADARIVFTAGDPTHPFELFVADGDGANERALTSHNAAWLDEVALAPAEELRFKSQSGDLEIHGWLLLPPNAETGKRHPLILQIHGGPHSMYAYALFHEMQLMAARGYAVLFTNPRGSAGYGETFTMCTRARWGESDAPDLLGALDTVRDRPEIDHDRIGVTGGSYGGYMTTWMIGHSDRFKAAATQRCVSNFHSMYGTSDIGFDFGEWEMGGTPWADGDLLLRYSPITYVEQIRTPLLIVHNEGDLRCPIEQAEQLFVALKRLGRTVEFVRIPEEDHNLSRTGKPSRRLARLHHLIGWFDRYL